MILTVNIIPGLRYGGEDAYFTQGNMFLGVADGIYEWRDRGIDAGLFSRALMKGASEYTSLNNNNDHFITSKDVFRAAAKYAKETGLKGSSTLCIFGLMPCKFLSLNSPNPLSPKFSNTSFTRYSFMS